MKATEQEQSKVNVIKIAAISAGWPKGIYSMRTKKIKKGDELYVYNNTGNHHVAVENFLDRLQKVEKRENISKKRYVISISSDDDDDGDNLVI